MLGYSCIHIELSNAWSYIPGYTKAIVKGMTLVDLEAASLSGAQVVRAAVRAFIISAQALAATLRITVVWLYIKIKGVIRASHRAGRKRFESTAKQYFAPVCVPLNRSAVSLSVQAVWQGTRSKFD